MRKKLLVYDSLEFTISPLNLDQVETLVVAAPAVDNSAALRDRQWEVVLAGLNNAKPAKPFTREALAPEMDLWLLRKLQVDIFEFSGLTVTELPETSPAGETRAASGK